jgi:hypothetical protein
MHRHLARVAKLRGESAQPAAMQWGQFVNCVLHPWVRRWHINLQISGHRDTGMLPHFKNQFVPVKRPWRLTLGCGDGCLERHPLQLGMCDRFDAFDVASGAVEVARETAGKKGIGHRVSYEVRRRKPLLPREVPSRLVFRFTPAHQSPALDRGGSADPSSPPPPLLAVPPLRTFPQPSPGAVPPSSSTVLPRPLSPRPPARCRRRTTPQPLRIDSTSRKPWRYTLRLDPNAHNHPPSAGLASRASVDSQFGLATLRRTPPDAFPARLSITVPMIRPLPSPPRFFTGTRKPRTTLNRPGFAGGSIS